MSNQNKRSIKFVILTRDEKDGTLLSEEEIVIDLKSDTSSKDAKLLSNMIISILEKQGGSCRKSKNLVTNK